METEEAFKEINEMLSGVKSSDGSNNLLEHLKQMFETKIDLNNNRQYIDLFEDISIRIKANGKYLNEEAKREALHKFLASYVENIKKDKKLLDPLMKVEAEGEEPTPITTVNYVPDYHSLFQKLEWSGISLGEKEAFLLKNSLRNLSSNLAGGNVTFFGKIFGTAKDYYIAEATEVEPPAEFNYDPDMEHRKEDGVNKNVFYVTNDLSETWVELPDIKPSQIVASRKIRYAFTGDLNRKIYTNPHFNGLEQHYLRCQIARIYHGAKLVPTINHYTIEDPEAPFKALVPNEKPKQLKHNDLLSLKNWIHFPPGILKEGRVSHFLEPPEEADPEEFKKKVMDKDPFDKRMKPISEDTQIETQSFSNIKLSPWKITQMYEDSIYVNPYIKLLDETQPDFDPLEQKDNKADYTLVSVKSLRWPGAYNFWLGKETLFFYFGWGLKFNDTQTEGPFIYKSFPSIPSDEKDFEDQLEPNEPPPEIDPNAEVEGDQKDKGEEEENQPEEDK